MTLPGSIVKRDLHTISIPSFVHYWECCLLYMLLGKGVPSYVISSKVVPGKVAAPNLSVGLNGSGMECFAVRNCLRSKLSRRVGRVEAARRRTVRFG